MRMIYRQPTGAAAADLFTDALKQAHLLIAGQTGSGKSVVINGIIQAALLDAPCNRQFILIDPKRVELAMYRKFPHVIQYASENDTMLNAIATAENIMDNRYEIMQHDGIKKHTGSDIYIIIDELADLIDTTKAAAAIIARIGRLGRAAKVHLIVATQYLGRTIPPEIKRNLTAVIGLHTRTAADSIYLIERRGCEALNIGECLYIRPADAGPQHICIPYSGDEAQAQETKRLLSWWTDPANYHPDETDPEYIKRKQAQEDAQRREREAQERQAAHEARQAELKAKADYFRNLPYWRLLLGLYKH